MGVRILSCSRCGIDEDDPRARQACAAVESASPYHRFPVDVPQLHRDLTSDMHHRPCKLCSVSACWHFDGRDGNRLDCMEAERRWAGRS